MAIEYQTALDAYMTLFPDGRERLATEGGADEFNQWWGTLEQQQITPEALTALTKMMAARPEQKAEFLKQGGDVKGYLDRMVEFWKGPGGHAAAQNMGQFQPELDVIDAYGYEINPVVKPTLDPGGNVAGDRFIGQEMWDRLLQSLEEDKVNRDKAQGIVDDVNRSIDAEIDRNQGLITGRANTEQYLKDWPDVAAWAAEAVRNGNYPTLDAAAKAHFEAHGRKEGRTMPIITRLQEEYDQTNKSVGELKGASETAAASKLKALEDRKAEMTAALERMSATAAVRSTRRRRSCAKRWAYSRQSAAPRRKNYPMRGSSPRIRR